MSSRNNILSAIRSKTVPPVELPPLTGPWIEYPDPRAQFVTVLESIGGQCVSVHNESDFPASLSQLPQFNSATRIGSGLSTNEIGNVDLNSIQDPHELENLDFAILPGQFGVAENGAVWVSDAALRHRAVFFLVQHLALVISINQIVHNMHQAYEKIEFAGAGFGIFIAGPSKTADIEQSLVIGAHGARSLTVFLVE